ncbi:MAG TPA: FAD-binding protein [Rhodothermales bacterium]|nr:FAD-binding protein [Rhodothermales bacterium]
MGLDIIRRLADALGAEVACSRPVVDKQWLPKSRQVGTSGKSVRPKLYVAVGISGIIPAHGGHQGPRAPIFAVADVGIVGDLFDIVPVLEEKIRAMKR